MATPISRLRGLGPAMEAAFARAGIQSAEALRALGTDAAYARLLAAGIRPHFSAFFSVETALTDRGWRTFSPAEKTALRRRFDALKAGTPPTDPDREAILDRIGVRRRQEPHRR